MARVNSTIIVSAMESYYLFVSASKSRLNTTFRMGLAMYSGDVIYNSTCVSYGYPGCPDAEYSGKYTETDATKTYEAIFRAMTTPYSSYNLNILSLVAFIPPDKPGYPWKYQLGLVDYEGFSIPMEANTQYTVTITQKLTYSKSI